MALGTNWTELKKGTLNPGTGFIATVYLEAKLNRQSGNSSYVSIRERMAISQGSGSGSSYSFGVNPGNIRNEGNTTWYLASEVLAQNDNCQINHDANGNGTLNASSWFWLKQSGNDLNLELYGSVQLPRIAKAPFVSSLTSKDITYNSVNLSFSVTDNGGANVTEYSIEIFTDSSLKNKVFTAMKNSYIFTGLKPNTTYYVRGSAKNSVGIRYTSVLEFKTKAPLLYFKNNEIWKTAIPYIKKAGIWKVGTPYIKIEGKWRKIS